MKILKILLIILVPAIGIVGCQKSGLKPRCNKPATVAVTEPGDNNVVSAKKANTSSTVVVAAEADSNVNVSARIVGGTVVDDETVTEPFLNFVGSGDDDRDGGDKKRKK